MTSNILSPSNESPIEKKKKKKKKKKEKKRRSPNQMTKVIGQSSLMKPWAKKGQKKNLAQNNQATWAKENQNKSPKNEMGKIQEMDSN